MMSEHVLCVCVCVCVCTFRFLKCMEHHLGKGAGHLSMHGTARLYMLSDLNTLLQINDPLYT